MNETSRSSVPVWVWLLGGCAILSLILICIIVAVGLFGGLFFVSSTSVSGPPSVVTVVAVTVGPENGQSENQNGNESVTLPPTPTDTLPQTPTPDATDPEATAEPTSTEDTEIAAEPTESLLTDDPFAEVRDEIEGNVIELRGLPQLEDVEPTVLTSDELRARLEADFMEDYSPEESRLDVLTLSAFDFLDRDFDLYNFSIDLLTEQVAGFYDPETDEFVIISNGESSLGALEQFTYAHEFIHALQDQHFALDMLSDETLDAEASFAIRALAEGDATLAQTLYISQGYFSQEQLFEILEAAGSFDTTVLDNAPPVLAHELEFPYTAGLAFVQTLYFEGGYEAVDNAWMNLPQSTEQIIHPDRYLSGDAPQIVTVQPLTDTLGTGWQRIDADTFGEYYLREYLSQQLMTNMVETAATGWGGDRYAVYWNEEAEQLVMVFKLVWDSIADGEEFFAAYESYPANLFGSPVTEQADGGLCWQGADVICLYQLGDATMIVRAPDLEMVAAVAAVQE